MGKELQKKLLLGTGTAKGIGSVIGRGSAPLETGKLTMSGELLRSLELAGPEKGNMLFRLLNTNLGEGLAAGLVAQLLAGGDEEEGPAPGSYEQRPFGAGGPGGQIGGIQVRRWWVGRRFLTSILAALAV